MTDAHNHSADPLHAKKEAWSGRFSEPVAEFVLRYTQSVSFDKRMAAAISPDRLRTLRCLRPAA